MTGARFPAVRVPAHLAGAHPPGELHPARRLPRGAPQVYQPAAQPAETAGAREAHAGAEATRKRH